MSDPTTWMVRAGKGAHLAEEFLQKNIVSISWYQIGDLSKITTLEGIRERYKAAYPGHKPGKVILCSGQINRFRNEFQIGDQVMTYNANDRTYSVGTIESNYEYHPEDADHPHWRRVKWFRKIDRDGLSTKTKNTLGSAMTLFLIDEETLEELNGKPTAVSQPDAVQDEKETLDSIKEDFEAKAHEFIKDKIQEMSWEDLQELVAAILRGMGYKTLVSERGPDRGKDIVASPDGLGLEDPKIKVEVKHRGQSMGSPEIRGFIGGLRPGEKGLYVSTGGFSKEAHYEAERSNVPITLIDSDMLVTLVVQNYDQFDADARALLPLRKIYWPI